MVQTESKYVFPDEGQRLALVVPPTYPMGRQPDYNPKPPLGLESLAGSLRAAGERVGIFDFDVTGVSAKQSTEILLNKKPEIIGMTVMQRALPSVKEIHAGLRQGGFDGLIVLGGMGATLCGKEILSELKDPKCAVFLGEAEETLTIMLKSLGVGGNWRETPSIAFLNPQDSNTMLQTAIIPPPELYGLPLPDRQNIEYYVNKSGYGTFLGSRGCPWSWCNFCSNAAFERLHHHKVWRPREPEEVVGEIVDLYQNFGVTKFKTNDPNLFGVPPEGVDHVVRLCQEIILAKDQKKLPTNLSLMSFIRGENVAAQPELLGLMKQAGWDRFLVGIESSSDDILGPNKFNKGESSGVITRAIRDIKLAGMSVVAGFMIFHPYSTIEGVENDLGYLENNGLQVTLSKSLRIFNGVPMQMLLDQEGRLEKNSPFETYHEYYVPPDVAGLYYLLKNFHVGVEDPIRRAAQNKIWELKARGDGFNQRSNWADLTDLTWQMESGLLKAGVNFYKKGKDHGSLIESVGGLFGGPLREHLERLGLAENLPVAVMKEKEFIDMSFETLTDTRPRTLHEEYVWSQD